MPLAAQVQICSLGAVGGAQVLGVQALTRLQVAVGLAGKCVDVAGAATTNGTAVQLYACNGTAAQFWTHNADGTLRALGKCLDIRGPSSADGTRLQIWTCTTGSNQKWSL